MRRLLGSFDSLINRIRIGVALLGIALVGSIAFLAVTVRDAKNAAALERHSQEVITSARAAEKLYLDLETGQRGFVITGNEAFLEPWREARRAIPGQMAKLANLVRGDAPQARRVQQLVRLGEFYRRDYSPRVVRLRMRDPAAAERTVAAGRGKAIMDGLRSRFDRFVSFERRRAASRTTAALGALDATRDRGIAALAGALLLVVAFGLYLRRGVVGPVHQLATATNRLATGDWKVRAEPTGARDVEHLAHSFNVMADSLEVGRDELARRNAELERARDEAEAAREEAERANLAKSEFLSRMSHELRTPLNAILGFGQLLEMRDLDEDERDSVDHILRGGRHLLGLINEVLDISRIESGTMSVSVEPVAIGDVIADVLSLLRPLAEERGVRLESRRTELYDSFVMADNQRLRQVILNLLSNAIKYNRENGRVTVQLHEARGRLRIAVADQGAGIPPDRLERLFVPFDRLGAEQSAVEGTGLGLALSKRLLETMGGTLSVRSGDSGSTFIIELPSGEGLANVARRAATPAAGIPVVGRPRRGKILYVEDNLANVKLIERILENQPEIELLSAMQGTLGIELARRQAPDVVLLDLHLPDMSGAEVLAVLRADPATAGIPVIVLSADATPGQVRELRSAGATDYLAKPIDVKRFMSVVETYVEAGDPART